MIDTLRADRLPFYGNPRNTAPFLSELAAGGLVFGGSNEGNFFALDDRTGKALWQFQTGGAIRANPISFSVDGRQLVAIAAGNAMIVFGLP